MYCTIHLITPPPELVPLFSDPVFLELSLFLSSLTCSSFVHSPISSLRLHRGSSSIYCSEKRTCLSWCLGVSCSLTKFLTLLTQFLYSLTLFSCSPTLFFCLITRFLFAQLLYSTDLTFLLRLYSPSSSVPWHRLVHLPTFYVLWSSSLVHWPNS